jgi:hypothetical protein
MNTGGSRTFDRDGNLLAEEAPTAPDPRGDAPRTAAGALIGADGLPVAEMAGPPAPATESEG